jgi:cytochrome c5
MYNYNEAEDIEQVLPCHDKLAFDTQRDAAASANVAEYRYGNTMHIYVCRYCHLWHLSSGPADED